jgi:capsular polysaccharide biosynthesis protein
MTYISPVSFHPYLKNPQAIEYVRDHVRAARKKNIDGCEKIFVRRGKGRTRLLENENEIEQMLVEEGFQSIDTEKISFSDQVDLFANAKIVVGVMCAAMCNTIVSKEGTSVILLAPVGWVEPFYWDLASVLRHKYTAVYGMRSMKSEIAHFDNFTIEPEALRDALS